MTSDERPETRDPVSGVAEDLVICTQGWEALRGDSLGWLLDEGRPNLLWRVLVELVGRPVDSLAARRARGGANAVEPVAGLLADLHPDGEWATAIPMWSPYGGPGWRLVAAVQWGANPDDPRLHAASERLLETAQGEGGLLHRKGTEPDPRLTARALEAMMDLGWGKHPRVQEWFAWFEATGGWEADPVVAVAVLAASSGGVRPVLEQSAVEGLERKLVLSRGKSLTSFGHPNLLRTDFAEIFATMAGAGVVFRRKWRRSLKKVQSRQGEQGRWSRSAPLPRSIAFGKHPQPSGWITLKATRALLAYAVEAELPRLFPSLPKV